MQKNNLRIIGVNLALYIFLYFTWTFVGPTYDFFILGANIFHLFPSLIATVLLVYTYQQTKGREGYFWLLLSLGCFSYLIAHVIWSYYKIILNQEPFPSWADAFWMLMNVIYLSAFLYKMYQEKRKASLTFRLFLDIAVVMITATALSWNFFINPILNLGNEETLLFKIVYIGYPIGDLGILFGVLSLYFMTTRKAFSRGVVSLITTSFLLLIIADSIYLYQAMLETYQTGNWLDILWSIQLLLLGFAGITHVYKTSIEIEKPGEINKPRVKSDGKISFLPYLSIILLLQLMYFYSNLFTFICSTVGISIIIIRQILVMIDNRNLMLELSNLNSKLESKVKERTQELHNLAFYDALTGIPNRRLFKENLSGAILEASKNNTWLAVMFLDIDRFKLVNDNLGHFKGDLLLQSTAQRLLGCLKEGELVARQGGDEFTVIIQNVKNHEDIEAAANRIFTCFKDPFHLQQQDLKITCSGGIAVFPLDGRDAETLMKNADIAMYSSKEAGKNIYHFYISDMTAIVERKLKLEKELYQGIEKKEFSLFYQPIVNINCKIIGVEALIRWHHPLRNLVLPGEFIPIAEETGLIINIGEWVLTNALRQMKAWHDQGDKLNLYVNISPVQLRQEKFVSLVKGKLNNTGLDPQYLNLEVTEELAMYADKTILQKLNQLKRLGIKISIDDFGTGYSSLSYLTKYPVDSLKIDREFVKDINQHHHDHAIVSAIITMANKLKIDVVAEGVETDEQFGVLKQQGCTQMQGFLFGKPMPPDEFEKLLHMQKEQAETTDYAV